MSAMFDKHIKIVLVSETVVKKNLQNKVNEQKAFFLALGDKKNSINAN